MSTLGKIALIAGAGSLPYLFLKAASLKGYRVIVIALEKDWSIPAGFPKEDVYFISPTSAQQILDTLAASQVKMITFLGKINKEILFQKLKLDHRAGQILRRIKEWTDSAIIQAVIQELEEEGFQVQDQTLLLKELFPGPGILTQRQPNQQEWLDARYGFYLAKKIAALDIGQTVVVKNGAPMAIEAIEGTDAAIVRGCQLSREKAVIVKVSRPDQDNRFDIPAIGLNTIKAMIHGNAALLVIEANRTLVIEQQAVIELADRNNIAIISVSENTSSTPPWPSEIY